MQQLKKFGDGLPQEGTSPKTNNHATQEYSTNTLQKQTYKVALTWLFRGVHLVPLQPQSKCLVAGFGPYSKHITSESDAWFWFQERRCNLALVTGGGVIVLDFDRLADYTAWRLAWPGLVGTYTEKTRRGVHVFLAGDSNSGDGAGFEVKGRGAVVMSAPSVHPGGVQYVPLDPGARILEVPANFPLLSDQSKRVQPVKRKPTRYKGRDTVSRIKAAYPVLDLAQDLTRLRSRDGRWWHGRCPFHDDKSPSFWVDAVRNLWGCYACKVHGDIINLYAQAHNVPVRDAIAAMAVTL